MKPPAPLLAATLAATAFSAERRRAARRTAV
jgi:hypothetical protein